MAGFPAALTREIDMRMRNLFAAALVVGMALGMDHGAVAQQPQSGGGGTPARVLTETELVKLVPCSIRTGTNNYGRPYWMTYKCSGASERKGALEGMAENANFPPGSGQYSYDQGDWEIKDGQICGNLPKWGNGCSQISFDGQVYRSVKTGGGMTFSRIQ